MPPRRPCPPQYSPPHPGRWRAASRAAPTRWYGLQPGDTRGHTVWTGTACGGADCKGDSTRIAKGILHASLHLSLRHEVARLIVWQVIRTRPVVPSNELSQRVRVSGIVLVMASPRHAAHHSIVPPYRRGGARVPCSCLGAAPSSSLPPAQLRISLEYVKKRAITLHVEEAGQRQSEVGADAGGSRLQTLVRPG